jgi:hypothetical protein
MQKNQHGKGVVFGIALVAAIGFSILILRIIPHSSARATIALASEQSEVNGEFSDDTIRKMMIEENKKAYFKKMRRRGNAGTCPCPYSMNRAGQECGDSSAYIKPGGESPWCFPKDISQKDLDSWKAANLRRNTK